VKKDFDNLCWIGRAGDGSKTRLEARAPAGAVATA